MRVLWKARKSNQSILKEINSEYSLEGLMLKLQYFGHLMQTAITSWEMNGEPIETVSDFIFLGAPKSLQMAVAAMKLKDAYSLEEKL